MNFYLLSQYFVKIIIFLKLIFLLFLTNSNSEIIEFNNCKLKVEKHEIEKFKSINERNFNVKIDTVNLIVTTKWNEYTHPSRQIIPGGSSTKKLQKLNQNRYSTEIEEVTFPSGRKFQFQFTYLIDKKEIHTDAREYVKSFFGLGAEKLEQDKKTSKRNSLYCD